MTARIWFTTTVLSLSLLSSEVLILPSAPVAGPGEKISFTANRPVRWTLSSRSRGTITSNGVYTAPSIIRARNQAGPCQLLPNDHIINTRIDSLPTHDKASQWLSAIAARHGYISYIPSAPINYTNSATPVVSHTFRYTAQNNGSYRLPPLNSRKYQTGEYAPAYADKHLFSIDTDTCAVEELYGPYDNADRKPPCAGCTAASGTKYSNMQYALMNGGTDAAATPIYAAILRVEEIERAIVTGTALNHIVRVTLSNALLAPAHVWPARAHALPWGGPSAIPYGVMLRLKRSFALASANPVTQLLLRQLKEYGMMVVDGGIDLQIGLDDNVQLPQQIRAAIKEIAAARIGADSLEVVDVSALMVDAASGRISPDNPYVSSDSEEIVATDQITGESVRLPIALRAVTVGVRRIREVVQAGSAPIKWGAWVNGTKNAQTIWRMEPQIAGASLTSDGVFTPPAAVPAPQATRVTVTSLGDPTASAQFIVVVLPAGIIRIAAGSDANYTDSTGKVWWAVAPFNGDSAWATALDGGHNYNGGAFPSYTDATLYRNTHFGSTDMSVLMYVPNGNYRIRLKMTDIQNSSEPIRQHLECQGKLVYRNFDIQLRAGGKGLPVDVDLPARVTDGTLWFGIRGIPPQGLHSKLSAFSIQPDPAVPALMIDVPDPTPIRPSESRQLHAIGWFMEDDVIWGVVRGPGTIDGNGVYTARAYADSQTVAVVRATSARDPSKSVEIALPLVALNVPPGTKPVLTLAPAVTGITANTTIQFTATIGGVQIGGVSWTLRGRGALAGGLYTAPADLNIGENVILTATSTAYGGASASVVLTGRPTTIRLNAGGSHCGTAPVVDSLGQVWSPDYGWSGTTAVWSDSSASIVGAASGEENLYRCGRYSYRDTDFAYTFSVPNGTYDVTLKWAEYRTADQGYKFNVSINGQIVLTDFNFVQAAGGVRIAYDRKFRTQAIAGQININFDGRPGAGYNGAAINAIEIIQQPNPRPVVPVL